MGAEVLSAEAGQPLPTRRQRKQGEGLRPAPTDPQASARETPDGRNDPRRVLARAGLRPLPRPLPVARSALSWPALPGERRPGQAQEPQVSRCPGSRPVQATLLQEPSTLSPTSGAPSLHTHTSSSFRSGAWPALPPPDQGVSPPERSLSTWKCTPDGKEGRPDDSRQKCGDFVPPEVSIFPGFHWAHDWP